MSFGPNPDLGTYEVRACDACGVGRICRYVRVTGLWLCNRAESSCYRRRDAINGRALRGEPLR